MVKIAKRVGVTDAAIYKHFKSKNEMLYFMIEELETSMVNSLIERLGHIQDPIEKLYHLLSFQFEFIEHNKGIPRIIFSESLQQQNKKMKAKTTDVLRNYMQVIKDILKSAKDSGQIRDKIDIEAAATIFLGMIQSSVIFWTLSDFSYSLKKRQNSLWQEYSKIIR